MDIKEFTKSNVDALKRTAGEKLTCPMCQHHDFLVIGGYVREDIQTQLNSFVMGSQVALNMAVVVCQNCGFVSYHDINILQKKKQTGGDNAAE